MSERATIKEEFIAELRNKFRQGDIEACACIGPQGGAPLCPCQMRGGLFPLPTQKQCRDPGHNAPTHISIPSGYGYRHVCPACGHSVTICPPQVTL